MESPLTRTKRIAANAANNLAATCVGAATAPAPVSSSGPRRGNNDFDPNVGVEAPDGHIERNPETGLTKRSRRDSRERPAKDSAGGGRPQASTDMLSGASQRSRPPATSSPAEAGVGQRPTVPAPVILSNQERRWLFDYASNYIQWRPYFRWDVHGEFGVRTDSASVMIFQDTDRERFDKHVELALWFWRTVLNKVTS